MAKRKINYNTAVDRIYHKVNQLLANIECNDTIKNSVLNLIASHVKEDATHTQGVPNPPPTPPGHGTGGGN